MHTESVHFMIKKYGAKKRIDKLRYFESEMVSINSTRDSQNNTPRQYVKNLPAELLQGSVSTQVQNVFFFYLVYV